MDDCRSVCVCVIINDQNWLCVCIYILCALYKDQIGRLQVLFYSGMYNIESTLLSTVS